MPRSYALGDHFETFIDERVKSGRYNNASEVVRTALRLLEDHEKTRELKLAQLRQAIEEGIASGPPIPAEEVFERLEARCRSRVEKQPG